MWLTGTKNRVLGSKGLGSDSNLLVCCRMPRMQKMPSMMMLLVVGLAVAKVDNIIHEVRFAEPYRSGPHPHLAPI